MSDDEKALKLLQRLQDESMNDISLSPQTMGDIWVARIDHGTTYTLLQGKTPLGVVIEACKSEMKEVLVDELIWDEAKEEMRFDDDGLDPSDAVIDRLRELGYKISKQ